MQSDNPMGFTLDEWRRRRPTRSATFTVNGVTCTDLAELEWRRAHNVWSSPSAADPVPGSSPTRRRRATAAELLSELGDWEADFLAELNRIVGEG